MNEFDALMHHLMTLETLTEQKLTRQQVVTQVAWSNCYKRNWIRSITSTNIC